MLWGKQRLQQKRTIFKWWWWSAQTCMTLTDPICMSCGHVNGIGAMISVLSRKSLSMRWNWFSDRQQCFKFEFIISAFVISAFVVTVDVFEFPEHLRIKDSNVLEGLGCDVEAAGYRILCDWPWPWSCNSSHRGQHSCALSLKLRTRFNSNAQIKLIRMSLLRDLQWLAVDTESYQWLTSQLSYFQTLITLYFLPPLSWYSNLMSFILNLRCFRLHLHKCFIQITTKGT